MTAAGAQSKQLLSNVEVLRFVAAFMVLVEHLPQAIERGHLGDMAPVTMPLPLLWRSGVDIFFIISGFIMLHLSAGRFGEPGAARSFLRRRAIRVAPMYWLFTTLMLAAALLIDGAVNNDEFSIPYVVASYLFIPWARADGAVQPLLSPGWTLNFEMLFYVLFAVGLLLPRRLGLPAIIGCFAALIAVGLTFGDALGQFAFWTNPIIVEFLFGMGLAWIYRHGIRLHLPARALLIAIGLAAGAYAELNDFPFATRIFWAGIPSLFIAAGVILAEEPRDGRLLRAARLGGASSYALYLSHLFSIGIVAMAWREFGLISPWAYMLTAGSVALAASVAIHLWIERPMLNRINLLWGTGKTVHGDANQMPQAPAHVPAE